MRRPWRTRVLAPAAALLTGAGLAVAGVTVLSPVTPPPVAAATGEDARSVLLTAAAYVGRPVDEVEAELASLGLRISQVPSETDRSAPRTVLALTPTGSLTPGDLVTLTVAVSPPPAPGTPVPVRPSTVAAATSVAAPSSAPGTPPAGPRTGAGTAAPGGGAPHADTAADAGPEDADAASDGKADGKGGGNSQGKGKGKAKGQGGKGRGGG